MECKRMVWIDRRHFLQGSATLAAGLSLGACARSGGGASPAPQPGLVPPPPLADAALMDETERRTFMYFWQTTDATRGLAPDYAPASSPASIAAMGFALSALPIGVSRNWVGRAEASMRALSTLVFLRDAPQGASATGVAGHRGFFYHFLDMKTGTRYRDSELSTIDTALLMMGVRAVGQFFDGSDATEVQVRQLAELLSERVEWNWMQAHGPAICMGWRPETGFLKADWTGFNEASLMYFLALGSASHPVGPDAWAAWTSGYDLTWGQVEGIPQLSFGALFAHQFTQVWMDMRGIQDAYMAGKGIDYFENTHRVALAHKAYATRNPLGWQGYSADIWGLSACDGPAYTTQDYQGQQRAFRSYSARGVGLVENFDDGTLCPAAAIGCLPHVPAESTACMQAMYQRYGAVLWGEHGFYDCYNPSFQYDVVLESGRRVGALGWVDNRYYGINQGPLLAMIENSRTGLLWKLSRTDPVLVRGLRRAGFKGGWLG
jgi:hypothetical protein